MEKDTEQIIDLKIVQVNKPNNSNWRANKGGDKGGGKGTGKGSGTPGACQSSKNSRASHKK